MIWLVFFTLFAIIGGYLLLPFLGVAVSENQPLLDEARGQKATIELDEAEGRLSAQAAAEARDALDRRVLALLDAPDQTPESARLKSAVLFLVPAVLLLGGAGLYLQVGQPGYQPLSFAEYQAQQAASLPDTLDELVVELRARLEADPNPPADGYVLLARSYLRLGDPAAGLAAYDRAIVLSEGAAAIVEERDEVLRILQSRVAMPQIDPETQARIQSMSADEQQAMIEGMVDGLAIRLEQDPNDAQGWMRLIQARAVMGDVAQARQDLTAALAVFPETTPEGVALQSLAAEVLPSASESAEQ
ncbi:MAG: c-type cytochrome biogenesis protein CcmI [Pseudomonadota bacterium]